MAEREFENQGDVVKTNTTSKVLFERVEAMERRENKSWQRV